MNLITMIAVLVISLLFTIVFVVGLKSRGPWGSSWTFFTIVCLWLAAVCLWIPPAGPVWWGVPWIDLFVTGLLVSFVMSATSVEASSSSIQHLQEKTETGAEKSARINEKASSKKGDTINPALENKLLENKTTKKDTTSTNQNSILTSITSTHSSFVSTHSSLTHEPFETNVQALRAGGFFWMLLLCLCALIIIGAH